MTKSSNSTNISMNNSSALVAPQRSEIRFTFSVEYPTLSPSTKKMLHRAAFVLTPVACVVLAVCTLLEVSLPSWLVGSMVVGASVGFVYGVFYIISEAERFEYQQKQKGGRK